MTTYNGILKKWSMGIGNHKKIEHEQSTLLWLGPVFVWKQWIPKLIIIIFPGLALYKFQISWNPIYKM